MTVHKLTAGSGYTYLTRQVAANDATERGFDSLGDYYSAKGETPGVWMGSGLATVPDFSPEMGVSEAQMAALFGQGKHPDAAELDEREAAEGLRNASSYLGAPYRTYEGVGSFRRRLEGAYRDYNVSLELPVDTSIPTDVRAHLRTELATQMFAEAYGRPPVDGRELSGHLARISRSSTTAVAGYDLTFSPVKSVSTLWAIASHDIARVIEQAHGDAVANTLRWIEQNATYTRRGRNGVRQVNVHGLIAAVFTHRDSRAGDPDLHTHVAISNKVQAIEDGSWLALDGRAIFQNGVAASERYNTRLEVLLIERLGVRFAERPGDDAGKRPVREIVGVDGPLPRRWSSRRAAIDSRRATLSAAFQVDHGRPPTTAEAIALAQQANLETREAKHQPRAYAEQQETWRAEALAVLGSEVALTDYIGRAVRPRNDRRPEQLVTKQWVDRTAAIVLTTMQSNRATWQVHHVRAEAERQVRAAGVSVEHIDHAVGELVTATLTTSLLIRGDETAGTDVPRPLRRRDGSSVYTVAGSALYTSHQIIAAEQFIVEMAGTRGGRVIIGVVVDRALATQNMLNPDQARLVRELATSGARVQLALAPAGTGKTTALRVLAAAWTADQPDGQAGGRVIGLAPSAAAASVLRDELGGSSATNTDTLAKVVHAVETGTSVPDWVTTIAADTLVIVDEAGMASTTELAKTIEYVVDRGGSVRLVGDDQQLAAIGAGGVLRDIAAIHGAVLLSQVMRFTNPDDGTPNHAEGAASLALRDGDPAAIAFYTDNGRVHVGDAGTVTSDVFTAWSEDRSAGRDAIMLAPTRELVAELNARARDSRLRALTTPVGREARLIDGSRASAGDVVITRQNDRTLATTPTDWVKNGDRWTVAAVHESGALDAAHLRSGRRVRLPAGYVAQHVTLGYATTVHGAQGITADASYTLATGNETRQLLYVAMTRGRHANHVFLSTAGDGDPHSAITRDALLPPTAVDVLTRVLTRDSSAVSATSAGRTAADPATLLGKATDRYFDALSFAAADHLGLVRLAAIDTAAEAARPGLTQLEAYPALRSHLALMAFDGHDPADVLHRAISSGHHSERGLDDARDVAAVLDWRLDPTGRRSVVAGPLPWLPAVPAALLASAEWGSYLTHSAAAVTATVTAVADRTRVWTPTRAPLWAAALIDRDAGLVAELAVWRAAHNIDDDDRRPTGPALPTAADARAQRGLDARVTRLLGDPKAATRRWTPLADSIDQRIATDPYWPTLADRLATADRAGIDISSLVRTVAAESPLPDEQPAAALWWRLSLHLTPAAMTATHHSISNTLSPDWTPTLTHVVGATAAERIQADPGWPAMVAAVTHAGRDGWQPEQLLTTAHDLLRSGQPDDEPLCPDELATALVWRIGMLTDTAPATSEDYYLAPELDDPQPVTPDELDVLGNPAVDLDDDWLASLPEPDTDPTAGDDHDETGPPSDDEISVDVDMLPFDAYTADTPQDAGTRDGVSGEDSWDSARVPRERLVDLNAQAAEFFAARYVDSWASDYLAGRLGTDLVDDHQFTVGYAPEKWTGLTRHLRHHGATDDEIVAAGLGTYASTGRVIDRFCDRLVIPIQATGPDGQIEIHGWVGRRNPLRGDADHAGPKYLNTSDTDLFTKGNELFGLVENAAALAAGATPVLVEGPMDAIAVTLAGDGSYVGVAPLGTAFTDTQADALRPYIGTNRPGVIVATDADRAGQHAAHRAFWQLAARGDDPRHLLIDQGKDPAEVLLFSGPAALRNRLDNAAVLAHTVIADRTAPWSDRLDTVEGSVYSARAAAQVIAALPSTTWPALLIDIVKSTPVSQQIALEILFEAHTVWVADPLAAARRHLNERLPEPTKETTTQPIEVTTAATETDAAGKAPALHELTLPLSIVQPARSIGQRDAGESRLTALRPTSVVTPVSPHSLPASTTQSKAVAKSSRSRPR